MLESIQSLYDFNLKYAHGLVVDVGAEQMTVSPGKGLENHPAWTLGHLVTAAGLTAKYLGAEYKISKEWDDIFRRRGPGDPRTPVSTKYPTKIELLTALDLGHQEVIEELKKKPLSYFQEETKWRFSEHMPTRGELVHFMCITHEAMHLSQLSSWRRAMDLPSALANL